MLDHRKLTLAEHNRDKMEEKASRAEDKIAGLREELSMVNNTIKTLAATGERAAEAEDDAQDKIRDMRKRLLMMLLMLPFKY